MRAAAALGEPRADFLLGRSLAAGIPGVPVDVAAAEVHLRRATDAGMTRGWMVLSRLCKAGGRLEESSAHLVRAGESGDPEAMTSLYEFYAGNGEAAREQAVEWARRGALWGEPGLSCVYAQLLDTEFGGLTKDPALSRFLLHRAAASGSAAAVVLLEVGRVTGRYGVAVEPDAGLRALRDLAGQDDAEAQLNLGVLIYRGDQVPRDVDEGARLIRKAARAGHAVAKEFLREHDISPTQD
jgi:TPR repeat protein